jgi:hypothetical protein
MTDPQTPNRPTGSPPSAKQLRYLKQLALERGVSFAYPATSAQASAQIQKLKRQRADSYSDRRREQLEVSRDMARHRGDDFAQIREALDDPKAGKVAVRYDAHRGFPRRASIDRIKNAIDDEIAWTVDRFRPLRPR